MAHAIDLNLRRELTAMFEAAKYEHFEDGMKSYFSTRLDDFIEHYGVEGVKALSDVILDGTWLPRVSAEALRWVPFVGQESSYVARRSLLEKSLFSPHPYIRDGAILGLSSLDDPHAISELERAIQLESNSELRHDMNRLLSDLREDHPE